MKTAKEKLFEWLEKQVAKEKDKWLSGMKNHYFEWEYSKKAIILYYELIEFYKRQGK